MGYIRPTNYELVKEADAIVVAKALTFEKKRPLPRGKAFGVFKFEVLERIKGDYKDRFILVEGDNLIEPSGEPNDFAFTRGGGGMCNATDYRLKGNYVLFLQNWKAKWFVGGPPFSRIHVMVEGTNAPWTKAVRQYARIAALNDYDREKEALRALHSRALANDADCPIPLVQDIDVHFSKPTPAKSFTDLRMLYEQTLDQETREYVLWACAHGEKRDAKDFFRVLLHSGEWMKYLNPVSSFVARLKLSGFHEVFAAALHTNRDEHERWAFLVALSGSADGTEQALMQKVLESVSQKEAVILGDWFIKHPSPQAIKHFTKLASNDYSENFKLTLALAGMGDTNVLTWAQDVVRRPNEKDWLGYHIFACSPLPAAVDLAREVIRRRNWDGLVSLAQGYEDSTRSDRLDRVKDIIAIKNKRPKLIHWLRRTLGSWAYDGDKEAERLLSQLPVVESE
jgi:hypothetical protein